jgi:hypothetical protein
MIVWGNQSGHDSEEFVVSTWMQDKKRISVACDIMKLTQSQDCNDDNIMRTSVWFECFGGLF